MNGARLDVLWEKQECMKENFVSFVRFTSIVRSSLFVWRFVMATSTCTAGHATSEKIFFKRILMDVDVSWTCSNWPNPCRWIEHNDEEDKRESKWMMRFPLVEVEGYSILPVWTSCSSLWTSSKRIKVAKKNFMQVKTKIYQVKRTENEKITCHYLYCWLSKTEKHRIFNRRVRSWHSLNSLYSYTTALLYGTTFIHLIEWMKKLHSTTYGDYETITTRSNIYYIY